MVLRRAPGYAGPMTTATLGDHLRTWRQRRRLSQLDLALDAAISTRHLSFLETGRAQPSREMLLHLAEVLDVPLRERNDLLLAAGFAPAYPAAALAPGSPGRQMVELVLARHEPWPAIAVDRHWNLVAANRAVGPLLDGVAPFLLAEPCNVLRLSLHPEGLAPRLANPGQWRAHILERLRRLIVATADAGLVALAAELQALPAPADDGLELDFSAAEIAVPFRFMTAAGEVTMISTLTVFGSPVDVTVSELALELFYPADDVSAGRLAGLVGAAVPG